MFINNVHFEFTADIAVPLASVAFVITPPLLYAVADLPSSALRVTVPPCVYDPVIPWLVEVTLVPKVLSV